MYCEKEFCISKGDNTGTVKFLNFQKPENFAVIYLKFKQKAQTLEYFVKKMQTE